MEFIIGWLAFSFAAGSVARSNNRNVFVWAGAALLLGPFAIVIVALLGPVSSDVDAVEKHDNT